VPTSSLRPNPHNPRMLFDELPLKTLEESTRLSTTPWCALIKR
jgi:hypothetical protein